MPCPWACCNGKLTSKLIVSTAADIQRQEADSQALDFLAFWKTIDHRSFSTQVFDSKFTSYENLVELDIMGIHFITLRRRGKNLIKQVEEPEKRVQIPHAKRKYDNHLVHDSQFTLRGYPGTIHQARLAPIREELLRGDMRSRDIG